MIHDISDGIWALGRGMMEEQLEDWRVSPSLHECTSMRLRETKGGYTAKNEIGECKDRTDGREENLNNRKLRRM